MDLFDHMDVFMSKIVWLLVLPVRILVWPYLWWYVRTHKNYGYYPSCRLDKWLIKRNHVVTTLGRFPWEPKHPGKKPADD